MLKRPLAALRFGHFRIPNGDTSLSPGLRGTSYPGLKSVADATPQGLHQTQTYFATKAIACFSRKEHRPWRTHAFAATRHALRIWPRNREATPLALSCETRDQGVLVPRTPGLGRFCSLAMRNSPCLGGRSRRGAAQTPHRRLGGLRVDRTPVPRSGSQNRTPSLERRSKKTKGPSPAENPTPEFSA